MGASWVLPSVTLLTGHSVYEMRGVIFYEGLVGIRWIQWTPKDSDPRTPYQK